LTIPLYSPVFVERQQDISGNERLINDLKIATRSIRVSFKVDVENLLKFSIHGTGSARQNTHTSSI
jgi:hypothetical protein